MLLEDPSEIYEWNLDKLLAYVEAHEELLMEDEESLEKLQKAKIGYNIEIHIKYLTEGYYTEHPSTGKVQIGKKKIPIEPFWEEVQKRKTALRQIIMKIHDQPSIMEARE